MLFAQLLNAPELLTLLLPSFWMAAVPHPFKPTILTTYTHPHMHPHSHAQSNRPQATWQRLECHRELQGLVNTNPQVSFDPSSATEYLPTEKQGSPRNYLRQGDFTANSIHRGPTNTGSFFTYG